MFASGGNLVFVEMNDGCKLIQLIEQNLSVFRSIVEIGIVLFLGVGDLLNDLVVLALTLSNNVLSSLHFQFNFSQDFLLNDQILLENDDFLFQEIDVISSGFSQGNHVVDLIVHITLDGSFKLVENLEQFSLDSTQT